MLSTLYNKEFTEVVNDFTHLNENIDDIKAYYMDNKKHYYWFFPIIFIL
jgi:hypothetical protein